MDTERITIDLAPTIDICILALSGNMVTKPHSIADISVAEIEVITLLGEQLDNVLPSIVTPKAVNGDSMTPIGVLSIQLTLKNK